jgi:hypothetical protein
MRATLNLALIGVLVTSLLSHGPDGLGVGGIAMADEANEWSRQWFEKGRGDALLDYAVFARFLDDSALLQQVKSSPECIYVAGTVKDPATLEYLRDTVGVVQYLLDTGGVAVLDIQTLSWFSPKGWSDEIFASGTAEIPKHVIILWSEDGPGRSWFHTRGMRKFDRPDLSFHGVTAAMKEDATELFNRFIGLHARGGWIPRGQGKSSWVASRRGSRRSTPAASRTLTSTTSTSSSACRRAGRGSVDPQPGAAPRMIVRVERAPTRRSGSCGASGRRWGAAGVRSSPRPTG